MVITGEKDAIRNTGFRLWPYSNFA